MLELIGGIFLGNEVDVVPWFLAIEQTLIQRLGGQAHHRLCRVCQQVADLLNPRFVEAVIDVLVTNQLTQFSSIAH